MRLEVASVMTGTRNSVAKLLKDENPFILSFHCLAYKLALACVHSADTINYILHCKLQLNQLWKLFDKSANRTAAYLKVQPLDLMKMISREQLAREIWDSYSFRLESVLESTKKGTTAN